MARLVLALYLVLNITLKSTNGLVLETLHAKNVGVSGGHKIPIDEAPYMAALFLGNKQWCGASVIDDRFVLTAAHCLLTYPPEDWKVLLGSDQLNTEGIFIDVEKIICHEEFDYIKSDHDICLLKLKESIPLGCFWTVDKIALPTNNSRIYSGVQASVIGWGYTEQEDDIPNELRKANVPVVDNACCRRVYPNITGDMICAGDKHNNFCMGDSGGPLVLYERSDRPVLIGVASEDVGSCSAYPGVYIRVASYLTWIQDSIRKN